MGENLTKLKNALVSPSDWLSGDPGQVGKLTGILGQVAGGNGVVLGGDHPPLPGKILIATGGTTGSPRFAIHTWDTLCAAAECLVRKLGPGISSYSILPMEHVSGFLPVVRAVVSGGKLVLGSKNTLPDEPEGLCISLVPTQLVRFLADKKEVKKLREARMVFLGGAAADHQLLHKACAYGVPLAPCYGMTETGAMVTMLDPEDFLSGLVGCGQALPGVDISIAGDGQVYVDTPGLCEGYAGGDGEVSRPFATNDMGEIDASGCLQILGRMDRVIITGGEKVDPIEVEHALRKIPTVRECLVVGTEDPEWGHRVTAFVTGCCDDELGLIHALRSGLPSYKIPKRIYVVGNLPYDNKGKVDWERIKALTRDRVHAPGLAPVRVQGDSDPPGGG